MITWQGVLTGMVIGAGIALMQAGTLERGASSGPLLGLGLLLFTIGLLTLSSSS